MNNNVPKDNFSNFKKLLVEFEKNMYILDILFEYKKSFVTLNFNYYIKYDDFMFNDDDIKKEILIKHIKIIEKTFNKLKFNNENLNLNYKYLEKLGIFRYNNDPKHTKNLSKKIKNNYKLNNFFKECKSEFNFNNINENPNNYFDISKEIQIIFINTSITYKFLCTEIFEFLKKLLEKLVKSLSILFRIKSEKKNLEENFKKKKSLFDILVQEYIKLEDKYSYLSDLDKWNKIEGNYISSVQNLILSLKNNKNSKEEINLFKNQINKQIPHINSSNVNSSNVSYSNINSSNVSYSNIRSNKTNLFQEKIINMRKKLDDLGLINDFFMKLTNFKKIISAENFTKEKKNFNKNKINWYQNIKKIFSIENSKNIKYKWSFNADNAYLTLYNDAQEISHLSFHSNFKKYTTSRMHIKINKPGEKEINNILTLKCQIEINNHKNRFPILIKSLKKNINNLQKKFIDIYNDIFLISFNN